MEQREKLIELLDKLDVCDDWRNNETIADLLIANGVVVLPCRCGECEHWSRNVGVSLNSPTGHCRINQDEMLYSDFCSYGKRKGGDE